MLRNYLDSVHRSNSLAAVHFVDTYFVNVVRTSVDFLAVVDKLLVDVSKPVAFRDDRLEAQHSAHSLVVHMVALPADSYSVDILVLE